jgi:uroporphyrinogen-III synthase
MSRKRKILISQPKPSSERSPYQALLENEDLQIDFKQFVSVEGVDEKEFREVQFDMTAYNAIVFTSKIAIDNFFRICKDLRVNMPDDTYYFCMSESFALYLQKYITYRKRKIFFGNNNFNDLCTKIEKKSNLKYLLPVGETTDQRLIDRLNSSKIDYTKIQVYKTVFADLSKINIKEYDILAFFTPIGIESLFHNFKDFKQENIKIATFGERTKKAANDAGLNIDIPSPTPKAPSMTMAIKQYLDTNELN